MPRVVIRDPPELTRAQVRRLVRREISDVLEARVKAQARLELGTVLRCDERLHRLWEIETHADWREYDSRRS